MSLLRQCQKAFESISSEWSFCAGAAAGVLFAPAALPALFLLPRNRAFFLAAGTLLALLFQWLPSLRQFVPVEKVLYGQKAFVEYEVKLTDLRLSKVPGLDRRNGVTADIRKLRLSGEKNFQSCSGQVIFYSNLPVPQINGALLAGTGTLQVEQRAFRRDRMILFTDSFHQTGVEHTWKSFILDVRDRLLFRLCAHISDDTNRNLAAAFFFGFTGGLTQKRKQDFAAAGTVHLFAVSGLHVGLAALLMLWGLRFLPFQIRCFTVVVFVFFYVLLTGAAVPAVRAGVMIGAILLCRGFLLAASSLRLLGAAAGVILIADPEALFSPGFHYSFFITAVLLLLSPKLKEMHKTESALFGLMPVNTASLRRKRLFEWGFKLKALVISGSAAAAAGTVVALTHSIAITPGAVIANTLTIPVLGTLFILLPVKLFTSFLPAFFDRGVAALISGIFDYLRFTAQTMAELAAPFYAFTPALPVCLLLVFLLLTALMLPSKRYGAAAGGLFVLLLFLFPLLGWFAPARLTVISSDSATPPTVVITDTFLKESTVINPVRSHWPETEKALRSGGVIRIAEVAFSTPSVRNASALNYLNSRYRIEKVILPGQRNRNWQFYDQITEQPGPFYYVREGTGGEKLHFFREKNNFAIEYPDSGVMLSLRLEIKDNDHGRTVRLIRNGKTQNVLLPWSNQNGVWQHEL